MEKIMELLKKMLGFLSPYLPSYTLKLSADVLQKRVSAIFPIKVKKLIFVFKISDPLVIIPPNTVDRIGVEVSLQVSIPGLLKAEGRGLVHGEIDYLADSGEFFFFDPSLENFDVQGLPRRYHEEVRALFESIMKTALSGIAIFKFDDSDKKQKIARRLLKSVRVEDELLKIKVGF